MPDFLTRRNGTWHFVRRVPADYARMDRRGIIRHSTKIRTADDRTGRRASRVAQRFNEELEIFWRQLVDGPNAAAAAAYDAARRRARSLGFDYLEMSQIIQLPFDKRSDRTEAILLAGLQNDAGASAALLGAQPRPSIQLSKLLEEYEHFTKEETQNFSRNQLRVWRGSRQRVVNELVALVGDKPVVELTQSDGASYSNWYRDRVVAGEVKANSANKSMGMLSRMLKEVSVRRALNLPEFFKGLKLRAGAAKVRSPFDASFIQDELLAVGRLDGLNEEARRILYVSVETGLRLSEVANLQPNAIHLDAPIPYVEILPEGRILKSQDSKRVMPLVGVALAAMKLHPGGFPRYRDRSSSLSALLNQYLKNAGLRPTKDHTVYSLRHSFKDRLIAAEAPDSLIDSLMGHRRPGPRYGKGAPLELKLKYLELIAFTPPSRL